MNLAMFTMVIQLLTMVAEAVPKITPGIKDLINMLKGVPVADISQEELELRVDAAIAKLPEWV